jgi:hypothetical protein
MLDRLIDCALAAVVIAIVTPGVIWWLQTIATLVWGPLP